MLILDFPSNPTAQCVELRRSSRSVIALAREHGIYVVHDLAYADICFDGWKAPSIMQVPGASDVAVEFFTHVEELQHGRLAHRLHGRQLASWSTRWRASRAITTTAPSRRSRSRRSRRSKARRSASRRSATKYQKRRDVLVKGLHEAGWMVEKPEGVDVRLGADPRAYRALGSLEFAKQLLREAKVAVSPGIGFGDYGDGHVRFALIENESAHAPGDARHQGDVPQGRPEIAPHCAE